VNILTKIAEHHDVWLSYLRSMGCDPFVADDLVQSMYLKVDAYIKKHNADIMFNETEVNYYFFWITLKNLYTDFHRKRLNSPVVYVPEVTDSVEDDVFNLDEDDYEKHAAIMDWFEDQDYEKMCNDDQELLEYDRQKLNKYYLRKIFEECFLNKKSVSELSRDTNITYWSLRNTIKIIKKQIQKTYEARRHTRDDI
jgi:DNA-directed RNA polymerase specialized sigma24 family protein